ncbi:hypothetical protein GH5_03978 [Leishmania sp. Ghana 2012 LV757]|uniref:hypothetical protein n=1 Tax=Leishmania sp. Ghana 2012 LV757 TaxID=2803181 RepID=UPI001B581229|nr:hypothetical protein GH5_03978 [Leishmania sp. Ghana 2012 LV757]
MPCRVSAVVVCGPSGVGKTTVGQELAALLKCPFVEGDDYHSDENKEKMRSGVPLTDEDRAPWLRRLNEEVLAPCKGRGAVSVVLACSALRRRYRDVLRGMDCSEGATEAVGTPQNTEVFFVMLSGDVKLIEERLRARQGHFMPVSLHLSQLRTLEALQPSELGATVDLADPPALIAKKAAEMIRMATTSPPAAPPPAPPTRA